MKRLSLNSRSWGVWGIVLTLHLCACLWSRGATITIVNKDGTNEGFNDPTPATPVGGNSGLTVGQQRLIVFQRAAEIWGARLVSPVPIRVAAQFDPLSCTTGSGTLGSAGPVIVIRDFLGAPRAATYYTIAQANAIAGVDLDPDDDDISATFNSEVGKSGCLTSLSWYYGLDGNAPPSSINLLDTILHEFAHGLGFISLVNLTTGARLNGFNDAYIYNLEDHGTGKTYPQMTDAERRAANTATGDLHWVGSNVVALSGILSAGRGAEGHVEMFAPGSIDPGSSVSHYSTQLSPDELMEPFATPTSDRRLTLELFKDLGWNVQGAGTFIVAGGSAIQSESCSPGNGGIDPDETVSILFSLRNQGDVASTNLVATLLPTGGVSSPSSPQTYGALLPNGPSVGRVFSFVANRSCGGTLTATLQLQDGARNLGTVAFSFEVGKAVTLANTSIITIPNSGPGSLYPSTLNISGQVGGVSGITVKLLNLDHANPDDLDVLLVGPNGQAVMLMSDAGGGSDVSGVTLTFTDSAAGGLPDSSTISSGTYKPGNYGSGDTFPSPAPGGPYGESLSVFDGANPNGVWSLYIVDDAHPRGGAIGGWTLGFLRCCSDTTNPPANTPPTLATIAHQTINENTLLAITNSASDAETPMGELSYSLISGPPGANLASNGVFTWTPTELQGPSTNQVAVVVRDDGAPSLSATQKFNIVVLEVNQNPTLANIPSRVIHHGIPVVFTNAAVDLDFPPNTLTFTLSNAPSGASIESSTGVFSWSPSASFIDTTNVLSVIVSDSGTPPLKASRTFEIAILSAPLIEGVILLQGDVTLKWRSIEGATYRVQYTTSLSEVSWIDLPGDVVAAGPIAIKTDTAPVGAQRFYRVQALR